MALAAVRDRPLRSALVSPPPSAHAAPMASPADPVGVGAEALASDPASSLPSTPARPRRADWPLSVKASLLLALAAAGGALLGAVGGRAAPPPLMLAALPAWAAVLAVTAHFWLARPLDRLAASLEALAKEDRPWEAAGLPGGLHRPGALGRIVQVARGLHEERLREARESKRLRRALDHQVAEETRRATHQLRRIALRDPLTDLANRRFLDEHLEPLAESHRRSGEELACLALDIDRFKEVNDTLGHAAGDELLVFVGKLLAGSIREADYAIRLGGDEFIVLLPGCGTDRALPLAQQLIALFRQHARTGVYESCGVSLSIGVAALSPSPGTGRSLLERADAVLYAAKRAGKDRAMAG